eukprot:jgi/Botrbrau1/18227/Bobra.53_1s0083.2
MMGAVFRPVVNYRWTSTAGRFWSTSLGSMQQSLLQRWHVAEKHFPAALETRCSMGPKMASNLTRHGRRSWGAWARRGGTTSKKREILESDPDKVEEFTRESDMGLIDEDYSPPAEKEYEAVKSAAVGIIERRVHSRSELEDKLGGRGFDPKVVARALDRMEELGIQSDGEFAEIFARSKWRQARWGPSRIRRELLSRGVSSSHIDAALHHLFGPDLQKAFEMESLDDPEQGEEAEPSRMQDLLETAEKQLHLSRGLPLTARRRRLVHWLERRGYGWRTISAILERLQLHKL